MGRNQKRKVLSLLLTLLGTGAFAQFPDYSFHLAATAGAGKNVAAISFNTTVEKGFGEQKNFRLQAGIRFNQFVSETDNYANSTCNCELYLLNQYQADASLNLMLGANYYHNRLFAGFNIDLVGIKLYENPNGDIYQRNNDGSYYTSRVITGKLNVLKVGYNDEGFLNSEFYLGYRLGNHWSIRGGLAHIYVQYSPATNKDKITDAEKFYNLGILGFSYKFGK